MDFGPTSNPTHVNTLVAFVIYSIEIIPTFIPNLKEGN
jgi:hypothetical protein